MATPPITLAGCDHDPLCHGYRWHITDENALAEIVARVVVGQYRHAQRVIQGAVANPPAVPDTSKQQALLRLAPAAPGKNSYHRDGWIFQIIAWIAAMMSSPAVACSVPHMQLAHKGFDAVLVPLEADGKALQGIVICEEKATENPRSTIYKEVWPDIEQLEDGRRDSELQSELSAILERAAIPNVDQLIEAAQWREKKRYRVSITISRSDDGTIEREALFKGYDNSATGEVIRRRAETLCLPPLRAWMDQFCARVSAAVTVQ